MTEGFEVFVHEVIAAIVTAPWSSVNSLPSTVTSIGFEAARGACERWRWSMRCADSSSSGVKPTGSEAGKVPSTAASTPEWSVDVYSPRTVSKAVCAFVSSMRSCGRLGPAMEGTTVLRSSSMYSLKTGSTLGSCHMVCMREYASTSATCSSERPVRRR